MAKRRAIGYRTPMTSSLIDVSKRMHPRRRDGTASRAAIAKAANRLFAQRGYALTSVRDIAALAGVNSALVGRYFGTKEELFRTILSEATDMAPVLAGPRARFGEHVVEIFHNAQAIPSPLAMMLLSMSEPDAREVAMDVLDQAIIGPLAEWLSPPDARTRARQLNMLWSGYLAHSQLLPNGPADGADAIRDWLAKATQGIVDRT